MISRKEIIFAMCMEDITNNTLRYELCKYINVCQVEVDDIITNGVDGYLEKFVAWVLNLKKFIPRGWIPEQRVVTPKRIISKEKIKQVKVKKGPPVHWTADEIAVAKKMRNDEIDFEEIAILLGRTVSSIRTKLYRKKNNVKPY